MRLPCALIHWLAPVYAAMTLCGPAAADEPAEAPVSFVNDVLPVLSKAGCNQGSCHGAAAGKGGFKLSLRGFAPDLDWLAIRREEQGRRVDLLKPPASLILRKPALETSHRGGKVLPADTEAYRIVLAWISQGAPPPSADEPKLSELLIQPTVALLETGESLPLLIEAHFSDGSRRDVTRWARFDTNDAMVATVDPTGLARAIGPGKAAISATYQDKVAAIEITVPFPLPVASATATPDYAALPRANYIDEHVIAQWKSLRLWPSPAADDATFLRRIHLDVAGVLPEPDTVRTFLADADPAKRDKAIDRLLDSGEFVDLWAQRWEDVFRLSREWVGERSVWTFHNYLRDRIATNAPWDQVVRELVAGTGDSSLEGPPNFYRLQKVYNEGELWPLTAAETTAQTFLGVRMQCARCHNHPLDRWTQADYYGFVSFFAQVGSKETADKSVVIFDNGGGEINHPRLGRPMPAKALGGPSMPTFGHSAWEGANWVWDNPNAASQPLSVDERLRPRYLRRVFELPAPAISSRLLITADDRYELFINGTLVGADGGWSPPEAYDVMSLLVPGKNVVAIKATNDLGPGGAIAWLETITANREGLVIGTDADWKVSATADSDWHLPDYDDSSWSSAVVLGPSGIGPWGTLPALGEGLRLPAGPSRRERLAQWITGADNPYFARATANRIWRHFMGRGLIEPVDDLRTSNPATNGPLLDALADDLAAHGYDLKHLMQSILRSYTYQLAGTPTPDNRADTAFYSHYFPKRMTAEQLLDAVGQVTGQREVFAGTPQGYRAQQLPDSKFPSPFLDTFGRPLRRVASCECERVQDPNLRQALEMMNSQALHFRLTDDGSLIRRRIQSGESDTALLDEIYLRALGRGPNAAESAALLADLAVSQSTAPPDSTPSLRREFFEDILWAVLNSKEFLFNH